MTKEEIRSLLPEEPPEGLVHWALDSIPEELGGEKIVFHRESFKFVPELKDTMDSDDWEQYERETKRHWGAVCHCTACDNDFEAGYISRGGAKGIVLLVGEDGMIYDGWTNTKAAGATVFGEGETLCCPCCYQNAELVNRADIRASRTYSALVLEVRNISGLTTLLYWRITRTLHSDGWFEVDSLPFEAIEAGYSEKSASSTAYRLLHKKEIREYINERMSAQDGIVVAQADEALAFLTSVMRGEIKDQFDLDAPLAERIKAGVELLKRYGNSEGKADESGLSVKFVNRKELAK